MAEIGMVEETLYVTMKTKNMPVNPIPSFKMMCSGGCGDEVWIDKKLERIWSKVSVLCVECSLEKIASSREEISVTILPESIESLMEFLIEINKEVLR